MTNNGQIKVSESVYTNCLESQYVAVVLFSSRKSIEKHGLRMKRVKEEDDARDSGC